MKDITELLRATAEKFSGSPAACEDSSRFLKKVLEKIGIKTSLISGKYNNQPHMWMLIWIDTTTGDYISPEDKAYKIRKKPKIEW